MSINFFRRYNYIITTTFIVVTLVSLGLFYIQFTSRYENELSQIKSKFEQRVLSLDYMMKDAINHVDAMQYAAENYLKVHAQKKYKKKSLLFSQLKNNTIQNYYHLDNIKPPFDKNNIGNLTGIGSLQNRSPDFYREIEMSLALNTPMRVALNNIPYAVWAYYTSANEFFNFQPHKPSQVIKFDHSLYNEPYFLGLPKNNPTRQRFWTPAYTDVGGKGLMVTCGAPVYDGDNFRGTIALDFTLDILNTFVKEFEPHHGVLFVLNQSNQLLAHPSLVNSNDKEIKLAPAAFPQFMHGQLEQLLQSSPMQWQELESYKIIYQNLYVPWKFVFLISKRDLILNSIYATSWGFLVLLPGLALILMITNRVTRKEFITPAELLVKHIENENKGIDSQIPKDIPMGWMPWFKTVSKIFMENRKLVNDLNASLNDLEIKNIELQDLDKLKNEFLANTSHELRTPLNGIIGIAESLIDGVTEELNNNTKTNLVMIVSSGKRLSTLVNDILDFSQLKHKDIELQLKPVGLREIVELILTLNQPLINKKPLQLINAVPTNLPLAMADENRLQQILHNLVSNAIKFTEIGYVKISAKELENNQLAITVADSGIGIKKDQHQRIFKDFEQAEGSTARQYEGTGLGLAITKQLVQLHGGKIWVQSTPSVGSLFFFTLPISKNQSQLPIVQKRLETQITINNTEITEPSSTHQCLKKQFKILIVDDEQVNLQVLVNHLSLHNYNIKQASSGSEVLTLIKNGYKPNIILLDVMMPRMTGYEVTEKLRKLYPANELPILMLTAKNQTADLVEGLKIGANDYLTKPVSKHELLARVKTHIHLHNLNAAYSRFVPHQFLQLLNKESIIDIQLGDQIEKEMTILFSDIRAFTSLSENMTPQENFNFINSYLNKMEPIIGQHNGFIDKYIGDAIMALFPTSADDAVRGSLAMLKKLVDYNEGRQHAGYQPIKIGIGLNTGALMLGTVGGKNRMDSTVISDAVNLASRIEGMTKMYNAVLLISEYTYASLDDASQYAIRPIDRVKVQGKNEPVTIYEVFDSEPLNILELKMTTCPKFEQALALYRHKEFAEATEYFKQILQIYADDKAAQIYLERCEHLQKHGVPDNWEWIEALKNK